MFEVFVLWETGAAEGFEDRERAEEELRLADGRAVPGVIYEDFGDLIRGMAQRLDVPVPRARLVGGSERYYFPERPDGSGVALRESEVEGRYEWYRGGTSGAEVLLEEVDLVTLFDSMRRHLTEEGRMRLTLRKVMDVIESTYAHDERGRRIDGDSPVSGGDVVEELLQLEPEIISYLI